MTPPRRWSRPGIAAGAGAGDAFVANVRAALKQIGANAAGAAEGRNPECLHQLRVGLRRLRSTLRAFRPLLRRRKSAEFDRLLREILRALGAARDWDVFRRSRLGGQAPIPGSRSPRLRGAPCGAFRTVCARTRRLSIGTMRRNGTRCVSR